MRRIVPALLSCLAPLLAQAEDQPSSSLSALGTADVETLDERAWVSSVSRRRQDVASAPAPVEVLLHLDLVQTPAATIADRLRYVPGVDVYQIRHGQFEVGLRGYNGHANNRILVLQDDWTFRNGELGSPMWTGAIDLSDLDRIEIAKGPASVTYGANAFGGVITLSTRPVGDRPTFTVAGRAGKPNALDGDATAAMPFAHGVYAKLSGGITRLWDLPGVESPVPYQPSPVTEEDTSLDTVAWRMRGMLGVRLGNGWNLESTARITRWERFEIADAMSYSPPNLAMDERMATIELRSSWLRLQHDERWTHDVYTLLKPDPTSYPVVPFQFYRYGFNLRERTSRALINANLGPHRLGFGAETTAWWSTSNLWSPDSTFSDVASWAEVRTRDWGAFAEDQVNLSNDLQLTSGLRIDDIAESSLRASPRVALNWRPSERTFTLLSYSGGYRPPTYLERFQRDTFVAPSDDLAPETIHAVEAQWRYRDGAAHELSLGAFANRSNNLIWRLPLPPDQQKQNFIDWRTGASPDPGPQYELRNLDNPTLVLGIEAGGRLAIPQHNLTLWANTTIQRYRMDNPVRFYSPGFEFPLNSGQVYYRYDYTVPRDGNGPPPWKVNLGADWARGHWFATAAGRLVGGRTAYDIGHTRLFSNAEPALGRVPSYAVADVGFGWRSDAESRCAVRLSVMDVFDSGHNETLRTTVDSLKLSNESQYTSDLGRMVAVAANWEF